ncbi:melatonin receptor type 1C-like [Lineus longissimus]|uniref:melatonin receptor type 1C-like n=1 Tax=Lineus longissimus TaxID=88925 RepID=UPI002B4F16A9
MDIELIIENLPNNGNVTSPIPLRIIVPYVCVQCLAIITGVIGNVLVVGAVALEKSLRNAGNIFILNLAIADLWVTGFIDPFSVVGALTGEEFFLLRPALCDFIGCTCVTTCMCSIYSIAAISVQRYIHICHHSTHDTIFTKRNGILMCCGLWTACFFIEAPNFFGWGAHEYDQKQLMCMLDRSRLSYSYFFIGLGVGVPTFVIGLSYLKIYLHVSKQRAKVNAHLSRQEKELKRRERDSARLTRTLFIIFIVYALCWLPYAIISTVDVHDTFALEFHLYSILFAHINSCFNSVIYGLTNTNFRRGYRRFLCLDRGEQRMDASFSESSAATLKSNNATYQMDQLNVVGPAKAQNGCSGSVHSIPASEMKICS